LLSLIALRPFPSKAAASFSCRLGSFEPSRPVLEAARFFYLCKASLTQVERRGGEGVGGGRVRNRCLNLREKEKSGVCVCVCVRERAGRKEKVSAYVRRCSERVLACEGESVCVCAREREQEREKC